MVHIHSRPNCSLPRHEVWHCLVGSRGSSLAADAFCTLYEGLSTRVTSTLSCSLLQSRQNRYQSHHILNQMHLQPVLLSSALDSSFHISERMFMTIAILWEIYPIMSKGFLCAVLWRSQILMVFVLSSLTFLRALFAFLMQMHVPEVDAGLILSSATLSRLFRWMFITTALHCA